MCPCNARLGPCAIKLGQAVSSRPDLLPPDVIYELQKLCDDVPAFPTRDAIAVIEQDLGQPVCELFADFDESMQPRRRFVQQRRVAVNVEWSAFAFLWLRARLTTSQSVTTVGDTGLSWIASIWIRAFYLL